MAGLGDLHNRLHGRLWHTTRPDRVSAIIAAKALLVEPDIDNAERWKTSRGPEYYPFVRMIGGVSLFDFRDFDANHYCNSHPMSSWQVFVPYVKSWAGSVWFEVDISSVADRFVSGDELVNQWDTGGHFRHTIMPRIEAAHIGNLPISAFCSAFMTWSDGRQVREFDVPDFKQAQFERIYQEWEASFPVVGQ